MILIITHSQDISADLVIRHLHKGRHEYIRLNTDWLGTPNCYFGFRSEPVLHISGKSILPAEISAIWARRFALPESLKSVGAEHFDFVKRELSTAMDAFLEQSRTAFQINSAIADRIAGNRLLQSMTAKAVGFITPDTLVTQREEEASKFFNEHQAVITKALSFGRITSVPYEETVAFTSMISAETDFNGLKYCPSLFQEKINKKREWRVSTVGNQVFAALIEDNSEDIDWRRRDHVHTFVPGKLPAEVSERLLLLSRASGIVYGAHDLIENQNGDFVFLETNPAGQWGWLELTIGLPIGEAIANELIRRSCGKADP